MTDRENVNKRVLSHSTLGWFKKSPAWFKFRVEHPEFDVVTPAFIFGNLLHTTVLEPDKVNERYWIIDIEGRPEPDKGMTSNINKQWKFDLIIKNEEAGKQLVTLEEINNAKNMAEALDKKAGEFINNVTEREQEIRWRHNGVDFKGFIDGNHTDFMFDLKSAVDATPREWQRKAFWQFDSHRQAGMYLDGDADGIYTGYKEFYFIVVEKVPPYLVSIHLVSKAKIAEGMQQYKELTTRIKACRKNGVWPDYDPVINVWE